MDRTLRAALVAAAFGLVAVGGTAWFLGMPAGTAALSGLVAAVAFGGLIVLAARRSDQLSPPGGERTDAVADERDGHGPDEEG